MVQLNVRKDLPFGLGWDWIKFSFSIYLARPFNFLFFSFTFICLSMVPLVGELLGALVLTRIYIVIDEIVKGREVNFNLNLKKAFFQSNIFQYALANTVMDIMIFAIIHAKLKNLGFMEVDIVTLSNANLINDLALLSGLKLIFFGVSLPICVFNKEITLFKALMLSWQFIFKHVLIICASLFLLVVFLFTPLYGLALIAFTINIKVIIFSLLCILFIASLAVISIFTIYNYKLYTDGFMGMK